MLELLIIMGLVTIMAIIAISAWNRYITNTNFREAARAIEADMKYMKQNALSQAFTTAATTLNANSYSIVFYGTNNTYTLQALDSTNNTLFTQTRQLSSFGRGNIAFVAPLPGGGNTFTLNFLRRGILSPMAANVETIVINNNINSRANITFTQSGKIYVDFHM